ncbi:LOW QUALITY PROTEIN: eukaryotic translation initiation factor 4G-like [Vitis riparia]|uniref:LOW QUALITY PROTEIN: eukaryotic translation initiation factor 4G-like n=1 Tax=Vitis riparia TaxID=96939 RepID=UPI00155B0E93|nr:LOW QUALITY PROTEIN: eukaryotic translation initiation factor 4G-like [Vitis riparia]
MISNINVSSYDRDSYPSPGRIVDRQAGGSRPDRRGSSVVDDDKWSKLPGPFSSGRDLRPDIGYGGDVVGFRSVQGGNYGVLRNPRGQSTMQYVGGILSGPMQSMGSQGGQRNSPDADRWQRATGFQKGLIPSPQTSVQMHRAEKKYEVGKATDEEEVKQRKLKAILNKPTPQNFEKLFEQVKAVNIDNAVTLTGVISQIFDKALMEPTFCEMYANFCFHLARELPDFSTDNEKITFKRLLLNKCQEEFERGEREQEEANRADEEGEIKQSEEEREEKRIKARRRMLGNIRLIGELYKKRMLTERIMHVCIKKLLGQYQNPDEEDVESLCLLMSTIGEMIDHPKAKEHMDVYFDRMAKLSNNMKLSSRVRFMLKDAIDLRKNKWQQRRKVEGPKNIEEVHRDAAQERQAQASRLSRGPSMNSSTRRGAPPMDFGPRGSTMLSSPNSQMGGFRGLPSPQVRGFGAQDVRLEDRQRKLKAILNKPTPQNFEKLFEQVKAVNIDNAVTLTGVISQIFDKALMEPTFCEMYANLCFHLARELPDFSTDNEKITFKRLLLNKCQEEFERREREQEEANRADEEGEIKQSEEEREEKRIKARRRMLGNIRLIGELYKKRMLAERIMHVCIKKLLGQYQNPDEEDVESLCLLMSTIGEMIDHPKAKEHMDVYFDRMAKLSNNMKLSSRVRFMLKDAIDLRKNKWQQRRKVEGPKNIEEVHRDAAQERQAQASRLSRGPSMNSSTRRGAPPMDFGPRGSTMLSSPNSQMGGFRGLPSPQVRGFGAQDVRLEDRQSYESRNPSVPLPHRAIGDDSITPGPQGGLARGMSSRGPPAMSSGPLGDISPGSGDSRRLTAGLNGYSSVPDRTTYSSREEIMPRYIPERFGGPSAYYQSSTQDRNLQYGNRDVRTPDRGFDRSLATSPPARAHGPAVSQNVPPEKVWPEERLRDMSIAAIKEFYSAKDENEVALCIKDLNSPGFYPSMVSIWVTDSFERKDKEMDMLAKLLVNLTKSRDAMLSQVQLIKGFEAVLTALEDAVNDAPKAAEFLGRIFAMVIIENVIPLRELGQIILEGGEEPGRLREIGLAAEVLGSTLEIIKSEKGENVLNEIRKVSNLRLDDFRPPDPSYRSAKLDKFI